MRILNEKPELWPYILASIFIHVLLLFLMQHYAANAPVFKEDFVEIIPLIEDAKTGALRIADIDKPAVEQRPKTAKFMGMYDSTAERETVGPGNVGSGAAGAKGEKEASKERKAVKDSASQNKREAKAKEKGTIEKSKKRDGDKLYAFNKQMFDEGRKRKMEGGDDGDGIAGGDFFPNFQRAGKTYLNVYRYPGVDYFVRLKRAFRIAFNPEPALSEAFTTGVVRGSIDVVLGVSVDREGSLAELFVFRSSGLPAYDEEALRTVRVSAPFSSPPDKFLEDDGLLRMSWTFTVYL